MRKVESISEESLELAEILKSKPQVEQKINYYESVLKNSGDLHAAIQKQIEKKTATTVKYIFGFMPVVTTVKLTELELARLKKELIDVEDMVFNQKQYYESWMVRKRDYEARIDEVTRECNQNFDALIEKAKTIRTNPRLANSLATYKNDNNDQRIKNEFYLYVKQEVNNFEVHSKGRR